MANLIDNALAYLRAGLSAIATGADKRPVVGSWQAFQTRLATEAELQGWFARPDAQVALICGAVSGRLEMIDFDLRAAWFERWKIQVLEDAPGLFERLVIETSQSGGKHVCYRYEVEGANSVSGSRGRSEDGSTGASPGGKALDGNKKLAMQPIEVESPSRVCHGETRQSGNRSYRVDLTQAAGGKTIYRVYFDDEKADKGHLVKEHEGKWYAIRCPIETRGEGGYFLCAPSTRYELVQGRFEALPTLTAAERDVLLGAARGLNRWHEPEVKKPVSTPAPARPRSAGDVSPLDDWADRGDVAGLLQQHGYTKLQKTDATHDYFSRPGKNDGKPSGSFWRASKVYKNFSTGDPYFQRSGTDEKAYSPGEIFAQLECKGDLSAAAKKLLTMGFGTKRQAAASQFSATDLARMDRQAEIIAEDFKHGRTSGQSSLQPQDGRCEGDVCQRDGEHVAEPEQRAGQVAAELATRSARAQGQDDDHAGTLPGGQRALQHEAHSDREDAPGSREDTSQRRAVLENPHWPGQPAPLGPPPRGDAERPDLTNFRWEERYVVEDKVVKGLSTEDEKKLIEFRILAKRAKRETFVGEEERRFQELIGKFNAKQLPVRVALNADEIQAMATAALRGWPMLMSDTWLFVDDFRPDGGVRLIEDASDFKSFIHDYFRPKFETGQDVDRVNYVSMETLYCSLLSSARNWGIVEKYPHWPPMPGHYYTWHPPADYQADGRYLVEFLKFFDNIHDSTSRAIFASAALTMFWGGPYGQRPLFIHDANMQGSGKSSGAVEIGRLAGGMLMTKLTRKDEDELLTRLLSPLGMDVRGVLWDNVDTVFKSGLVAQLITADPWISGRRLREGEGRRPANLVCFASLNAARVDSDMARRCLFTYFTKPKKGNSAIAEWKGSVTEFVTANMKRLQADGVHVLRMPAPKVDWGTAEGETFSLWAEQVLARALSHPGLLHAIMDHPELECKEPATVLDVMETTKLRRNERNKDIEEAETFLDGLCERVVAWKRMLGNNTGVLPSMAAEDVFIRTSAPPGELTEDQHGNLKKGRSADDDENIVNYWEAIFDKRLTGNQVVDILNGHILAGRMRGLRRGKHPKTRVRGFILDFKVINEWLEARKEAIRAIELAESAKAANTANTANG